MFWAEHEKWDSKTRKRQSENLPTAQLCSAYPVTSGRWALGDAGDLGGVSGGLGSSGVPRVRVLGRNWRTDLMGYKGES